MPRFFYKDQSSKKCAFLIVGLGNPGIQYQGSRHNAGFEAINVLSQQLGVALDKKKHHALIGQRLLEGKLLILAKPQTYMNLSGQAVQAMLHWYKLPLDKLIIIYDDVDLPFGSLRVRREGGPGTHNGMRSIVQALQSEAFPRVRLGIGRPPAQMDLADYVLAKFPLNQQEQVRLLYQHGADAASLIALQGVDAAMAVCNAVNIPHIGD